MDKRRKIEDIEYHEVFQQTVDMDKDLTKVGDTLMILVAMSLGMIALVVGLLWLGIIAVVK